MLCDSAFYLLDDDGSGFERFLEGFMFCKLDQWDIEWALMVCIFVLSKCLMFFVGT